MSSTHDLQKTLTELKQQTHRIEHMLKFLIQERNLCLLTVPKNDLPEFKNDNPVLNELNTLLPLESTKSKIQTPMVSPRRSPLLAETKSSSSSPKKSSHRKGGHDISSHGVTNSPSLPPPTQSSLSKSTPPVVVTDKFFEGEWKTKEEEDEFINKHF